MQETTTTPGRRRGARALLWLALGSLVAIAMLGSTGASVLAVHITFLHQTPPISFDDPEFQGSASECAGTDGNWHFVLVQTAASSATLTATFEGGVFVVGSTKKTGSTLHFDVPAGDDTLIGASVNATGKWLNLSHICGGTTTTTTTTSSSSSSSSTSSSGTTSAP